MAIEKVKTSTTVNGEKKEYSSEFDFGNDAQDAITKFGADVVYDYFVRGARIAYQSVVRAAIESGKSDAEIAERIAPWKPGVTLAAEKVDPEAAFMKNLKSLSPEEQKAKLAELKKMLLGG